MQFKMFTRVLESNLQMLETNDWQDIGRKAQPLVWGGRGGGGGDEFNEKKH